MLAVLLCTKYKKYIKYVDSIAQYSHQSTRDLICYNKNGEPLLVELELLLSNTFKHEHPYQTFDCIVCWKIDIEVNERRKLVDGVELKLIFEKNQWLLKYGTDKVISMIELSEVVRSIVNVHNHVM